MFNIPTITKNLLIINILCFIASYVLGLRGIDFEQLFGLHYFLASDFRLWQFFTYMFMHGSLSHLFFNMFALWMFGGTIERTFGQQRFLAYYIICGLGAALCQEVSQFVNLTFIDNIWAYDSVRLSATQVISTGSYINMLTTVGASGSIYGILLAFGMCYPDQRMFIFPLPVPIKAKWFVIIYVVLELFFALSNNGDGVAHIAHLGGMLFGFVMIKLWGRKANKFNGWDGYEVKDESKTILGRIRSWLHLDRKSNDDLDYGKRNASTRNSKDWEYNAKKKQQEEEIDRILDKIRRSGYESLSDEEKKRLFENRK